MATKIDNLSYTNKDFNAIFEELLVMGDELSAKWKPSATNESDPGIVLIKENAVIGDKLDYNIDKNILEAFPSSVTQEGIARQLFEEQLACPAQWYKAASGIINFRYIPSAQDEINLNLASAVIPMYTIVQNGDANISYTIIDHDKVFHFDGTYNESGYNVLQGIPNEYTIGTNNVIAINNLDNDRRLYFQEYNVAQNGIFVSTVNHKYDFWNIVELLSVQTYGDRVVKFGVDKNNRCYLEFPTWIDDIIEDGLYITYITTDGANGSVAVNQLTQFGNDVTLTPTYISGDVEIPLEDVTLNSENIAMQNPYAITNGEDPDTIEEMFDRWKRIAGTFNTLVTINDYDSALPRDIVGNGFACDRTNDLQSSYNIIHTVDGKTKRLHKREKLTTDDAPAEVQPYDIKLYLTQLPNAIQTAEAYKKSFEFVDNFGEQTFDDGEEFEEVKDSLVDDVIEGYEENKCISQDFATVSRYKPLFFKNKYPINCTIIPVGRLSERELAEIKRNVVLALYNKYNGTKMHFGEEIDYDDVYDTIKGADERISAIHLQDIEYKTYAVYKGSEIQDDNVDKYIEVEINSMFEPTWYYTTAKEAIENGGKMYVGTYDPSNNSFTPIGGSPETSTDYLYNELVNLDSTSSLDKYIGTRALPSPATLLPINNYNGKIAYNGSGDLMNRYPWGTEFATDIFAKSVLNGNTPFVNKDTTYARSIAQKVDSVTEAYYITTNSNIEPSGNTYTVKENENIQIFSPSYQDELTFAYGSKMQYKLSNDIPANTDYTLGASDEILMFWRSDSNSDYQWKYFGKGSIIHSTTTLYVANSAEDVLDSEQISETPIDMSTNGHCGPWLGTRLGASADNNQGTTSGVTIEFSHDNTKYPAMQLSNTIYNEGNIGTGAKGIQTATKMLEKLFVLSFDALQVNDSIVERKKVEIPLNNKFMYFWILNSFIADSSYPSGYKSVLFAENEEEYTLQNGEYLFYTNIEGTAMYQLGAGTKLTRDINTWNEEWACDRVDLINYMQQSDSERSQYWKSVGRNITFKAKEQTISSFGKGTRVTIEGFTETINNTLQPLVGATKVKYKLPDDENVKELDISLTDASIKTSLQLISTPTNAQKLSTGQQIILWNSDISSSITIDAPSKILTSRECDYEGIKVNAQSIDVYNNRLPLKVYVYKDATANIGGDDYDYIYNQSGGINFDIDGGDTLTILTGAQVGSYLLPFKYVGNDEVEISIDSNPVKDMSGSAIDKSNKQYYLDIQIEGTDVEDVTLTFTSNSDAHCEVGELIKYTMTDALAGDAGDGKSAEWHLVLQRIRELDPKAEFNYGYQIDTNDLIENPIEATSFNNPKHIMNRYTICEMDIDAMGEGMSTIKVLNSAR